MYKLSTILCFSLTLCASGKDEPYLKSREFKETTTKTLIGWISFVRNEPAWRILFSPTINYPSKLDPFFNDGPPRIYGVFGSLDGDSLLDFIRLAEKPMEMNIWETSCSTEVIPMFRKPGSRPSLVVECSISEKTVLIRFRTFDQKVIGDCLYGKSMVDLLNRKCVAIEPMIRVPGGK